MGEGRAAVVGQRAEQRVGVDQVGGVEGHAGGVGEEVVAPRDERGAGAVEALTRLPPAGLAKRLVVAVSLPGMAKLEEL